MLKRKKIAGSIIIAVLISSLFFIGCRHSRTPEKIAERAVEKIADKLDLDEFQQEQIKGIKDDVMAKVKGLRKSHKNLHDVILAQLQNDVIDRESVLETYNANKSLIDELFIMSINRLVDFHTNLSQEQKAKLLEEIKDMRSSHKCSHSWKN